jgi:MSHA biogenesis protein MshJ
MKALSSFWRRRKPRERALVVVAGVAAVVALVDSIAFAPQRVQMAAATRELAAARTQLEKLQQMAARHAELGDSATQERLLTLQARRAAADETIRAAQVDLIAPQQMAQHLGSLLQHHPRLRVLAAQSMAPAPFSTQDPQGEASAPAAAVQAAAKDTTQVTQVTKDAAPKAAAGSAGGDAMPGLYQHGFELTIEGRYLDLVAWLDALEKAPRRMYWRELEMKVGADGVPVTRLALFTLSSEATWLKL